MELSKGEGEGEPINDQFEDNPFLLNLQPSSSSSSSSNDMVEDDKKEEQECNHGEKDKHVEQKSSLSMTPTYIIQPQQQNEWPEVESIADRISREREEMVRASLVEDLVVSVRYIIYTLLMNQDTNTLTSNSFGVDRLCMSIERILCHQLNSSITLWKVIVMVEQEQSRLERCLKDVGEFRDIQQSRSLFSERGRYRSYIRSVLNHGKLSLFLTNLTTLAVLEKTVGTAMGFQTYGLESIIHHKPSIDSVISLFKQIDDIKFSLTLNSMELELIIDQSSNNSNNNNNNNNNNKEEDIRKILYKMDDLNVNNNNININNKKIEQQLDKKIEGEPTDEELIAQFDQNYEDLEGIESLKSNITNISNNIISLGIKSNNNNPNNNNNNETNIMNNLSRDKKNWFIKSITSNQMTVEQAMENITKTTFDDNLESSSSSLMTTTTTSIPNNNNDDSSQPIMLDDHNEPLEDTTTPKKKKKIIIVKKKVVKEKKAVPERIINFN
ncbi:hypothetical protein DFA_01649 [Cavenderia fasciculata]|uniref:RUN domain-containing protein n=1 Tax=Cavenderia fasciculata TaxID=261658 RepID=F4PTZ5_CACFS|nr:uncharacterized protein DFA_01649 [Cavenderia fasciculata]EGG21763.1 hypothetical protein DFA_01649 [Cavenderia fasciculata]|eukprot:XP_004359613.1 hypothetical protein DFA_01649 [Cavenderia fasciculata]